jgi:hypothetical protein
MDENLNCRNFEESNCLCHKKFDCVNKRLEKTFKDIIEMSEEMHNEKASKLKKGFVNKLSEISDRERLKQ